MLNSGIISDVSARRGLLLRVTRIIRRIDIRNYPRADAVELNDGITLCPSEMPHSRRPEAESSLGHFTSGRLVELLTHAKIESPGNDGYALDLRVPVRLNPEAIR